MDIGLHILGSVPSNESPGQTEQDRSGFDCFQRSSKLAKTSQEAEAKEQEDLSSSAYCKTMSFHQGIPLMRSPSLRQEHMLSFSDKSESLDFTTRYLGSLDKNSPLSPPFLSPSCFKPTVGGMMSMQGNFTSSVKGPFTLTQWAELEQQALIYKYITANVPVPSSLLISIKKSFYPYGSSLPPTTSPFGWGSFHIGLAGGNMDPEPGRCRRTDGKKWRCARDAVPDQKYCERHINRGRHRSRKPVEVQSSQTATSCKAVTTLQQQPAVTGGSNRTTSNNRNRNPQEVSVYPSTVNDKHRNNNSPFEFGHISSDSLLNPTTIKSYDGSSSFLDFSGNQDKHSRNHNPWPEELKSDWTQLSMSIPLSSSTPQDKTVLSPLRLSRELQTEEETLEAAAKKANNTWIPISWGNNSSSLGGPLGEVVLNSPTTLASSPTGVLQKSTFCSLSNTSSVSSPPPPPPPMADHNNRNNVDYFLHYTT